MTSQEIFSMGYAIPAYDIREQTRTWRFNAEAIELPANAVRLVTIPGVNFYVSPIDEVRKAANERA